MAVRLDVQRPGDVDRPARQDQLSAPRDLQTVHRVRAGSVRDRSSGEVDDDILVTRRGVEFAPVAGVRPSLRCPGPDVQRGVTRSSSRCTPQKAKRAAVVRRAVRGNSWRVRVRTLTVRLQRGRTETVVPTPGRDGIPRGGDVANDSGSCEHDNPTRIGRPVQRSSDKSTHLPTSLRTVGDAKIPSIQNAGGGRSCSPSRTWSPAPPSSPARTRAHRLPGPRPVPQQAAPLRPHREPDRLGQDRDGPAGRPGDAAGEGAAGRLGRHAAQPPRAGGRRDRRAHGWT